VYTSNSIFTQISSNVFTDDVIVRKNFVKGKPIVYLHCLYSKWTRYTNG